MHCMHARSRKIRWRNMRLDGYFARFHKCHQPFPTHSVHCKRRRLCRLLLSQPDLLLLDEPTNHLDAESVAWLERYLRDYRGAVLAITHDRYFLDNVAGWILEMDRGMALPFKGNYSSWLVAKQKRLDLEHKKEAAQSKQLKRELDWINGARTGQTKKGKARTKRLEEQTNRASASMAYDDRFESGAIKIPLPPRLGKKVLKVEGLSKAFEEGQFCSISRGPPHTRAHARTHTHTNTHTCTHIHTRTHARNALQI